jgi:hypothetical protein
MDVSGSVMFVKLRLSGEANLTAKDIHIQPADVWGYGGYGWNGRWEFNPARKMWWNRERGTHAGDARGPYNIEIRSERCPPMPPDSTWLDKFKEFPPLL